VTIGDFDEKAGKKVVEELGGYGIWNPLSPHGWLIKTGRNARL
jgi:hypothetical protein